MKHKFHSLTAVFLSGCLLIGSAAAVSFPDVDADAPYAQAVEYVSEMGLMIGDSYGNFNPDQIDTRGKMAAIISQMMGLDVDSTAIAPFSDAVSHWAGPCIAAISDLGVVKGYGNGCYGPSDDVTYEQAVAMIVRIKGWEAEAVSRGGWPNGYLAVAQDHGLLDGVSSTLGAPFTRAQVAQVIYNALAGQEEIEPSAEAVPPVSEESAGDEPSAPVESAEGEPPG